MNEAIQSLADLSPLAAIVIIAGVAATVLTQVAKRSRWTKGQTEAVALGISGVLGVAAYIVSGLTGVFPASFVEAVSTGLVIIAGVAVTSRAAYALLGHAIPDGTTPEPPTKPETMTAVVDDATAAKLYQRGRYADRDGTLDGRVTPDA